MTVEFENPESPSAGVRICANNSASNEHIATRSERTFPLTKSAAAISSMDSVIIIFYKTGAKSQILLPLKLFLGFFCLSFLSFYCRSLVFVLESADLLSRSLFKWLLHYLY